MPKWQRNLFFIFFMLAGVIVGTLVANLAAGVSGLDWLSYGRTVGISPESPMVLELAVARLAFGFSMSLNVSHIICIIAAFLLYRAVVGRR